MAWNYSFPSPDITDVLLLCLSQKICQQQGSYQTFKTSFKVCIANYSDYDMDSHNYFHEQMQ